MQNQNELNELLNSSNSILNDSFSIPLEGKINFCKNNKKIDNHLNKKISNEFNNNNNIHIIKKINNNNKNNNDNLLRTLISISTSTTTSLINLSNNNNEIMNKTSIKKLKNNLNNKIIYPNKFIETNLIKNKNNNIKTLNNNNNEHINKNLNKIIPLKYAKKQYRRHSGFNHHKCDIDDCEKEKKKSHKKTKKKKVNFKNDFIEIINVESWKSFNNLTFSKSINIKKIKNQYDCSCLIM